MHLNSEKLFQVIYFEQKNPHQWTLDSKLVISAVFTGSSAVYKP